MTSKKIKVFVTGGSGFIGKNLISKLVTRGFEVTVLLRKKRILPRKVKIVIGRLEEPKTFINELNKSDVLIHLAAIRTNGGIKQKVFPINSDILDLIITPHTRLKYLIVTSSVYVFGSLSKLPADETHTLNARDIYGLSKIRLEEITKKVSKKYNVPYCIVRPAIVYGPGDSQIGFMTKLIGMLKKNFFPMIGRGENLIDLIYIDDLVDGYLEILKKRPKNEVFILASGNPVKLKSLINIIGKELNYTARSIYIPRFPILFLSYIIEIIFKFSVKIFPSFDGEPWLTPIKVKVLSDSWSFDISKARKILNFNPKIDYKEGISRTLESWS